MASQTGKAWPTESIKKSAKFWVEESTETITRINEYIRTGWYLSPSRRHGNATGYSVLAGTYKNRTYSQYILGKGRDELFPDMQKTIEYDKKALDARVNPFNPDYIERPLFEAHYSADDVMDDMYDSLITGDYESAKQFAASRWIVGITDKQGVLLRYEPGLTQTGNKEFKANYVKSLACFLLRDKTGAKNALDPLIRDVEKRGIPKARNYRHNFYTMMKALHGIIEGDEAALNKGLLMKLEFDEHGGINPHSEYYGVPEYFISEDAVALANLALHEGMRITIKHFLLPEIFQVIG